MLPQERLIRKGLIGTLKFLFRASYPISLMFVHPCLFIHALDFPWVAMLCILILP
jgi:hypothetical protein